MQNANQTKLKMWIILLENYNYKPETIFDLSKFIVSKQFNTENNVLFSDWVNDGMYQEKFMMYNTGFLFKLEDFLIKNGIHFNWINYKNKDIGIRIQPTKIDFSGILYDCMTFEKFSWYRHYMAIRGENNGNS